MVFVRIKYSTQKYYTSFGPYFRTRIKVTLTKTVKLEIQDKIQYEYNALLTLYHLKFLKHVTQDY